jgi:hypothetical protein
MRRYIDREREEERKKREKAIKATNFSNLGGVFLYPGKKIIMKVFKQQNILLR